MTNTTTEAWHGFTIAAQESVQRSLADLLAQSPDRTHPLRLRVSSIFADFSKTHLHDGLIHDFTSLLNSLSFSEKRLAMFSGEKINSTEGRAVLHTALRNRSNRAIYVDGEDVMPDVRAVLEQMQLFSDAVHSGAKTGFTGKKFTDVVNIGIGGSDLGPRFVCAALQDFAIDGIRSHFVSNVDASQLADVLASCSPETTLFLIASKTFTTQETMMNAHTARAWFLQQGGTEQAIAQHFVALSTNEKAVNAFGIPSDSMFAFWDWVGGRYSLWSAIGLSICLSVGFSRFEELLQGAFIADEHFASAPPEENIPLLMACTTLLYIQGANAQSYAVLPYSERLRMLPKFLQQLDMESNGKYITLQGKSVSYSTAPVLWGEPGTDSQHSFFQMLHQGTAIVPCDMLAVARPHHAYSEHHHALMANFFAQTEALAFGKNAETVAKELQQQGLSDEERAFLLPHKVFPGNRPSVSFLLDSLTPQSLGTLLALYEHKVFTLGVLWNINSFDQWGVELGKQLAKNILPELTSDLNITSHDDSTNALINEYKRLFTSEE